MKPALPGLCDTSRSIVTWAAVALGFACAGFAITTDACSLTSAVAWGGTSVLFGFTAVAFQGSLRDLRGGRTCPFSRAAPTRAATYFTSIDDLPADDWERVVPADNPYMQLPYLRGLAAAGPRTISHRYAVLHRNTRPIAVAYFQLIDVAPESMGKDARGWSLPVRLFLSTLRPGRGKPVRLLMCGDVFHSKTDAFAHTEELSAADAAAALAELSDGLCAAEAKSGRIALSVFKDLSLGDDGEARLRAAGYHTVHSVQPTMVVPLRDEWRSFTDYLAGMRTKYRSRAIKARRRGRELQRRVLSGSQIDEHQETLAGLLAGVTARADFKLATMSLETLRGLERHLADRFVLTAYLLGERIVGFSAAIVHERRLEALLVGIDYSVNRSHALYENMLYDFVERGIERGCGQVHLGRTALEIKSTLGAVPVELPNFVRHTGTLWNLVLGLVVGLVQPKRWIQRRPFDKYRGVRAPSLELLNPAAG